MLAGVALIVNFALSKKWSVFENDKVRWATTAALAGIGGLVTAWIADEPVASAQTFVGALKVFAFAVFTYVSSKKLLAAPASTDAQRAAA